jgi:hypothetical protein
VIVESVYVEFIKYKFISDSNMQKIDLKVNVIVESVHVEFIKYKFISDSNMQEIDLKVMTPSSTPSEKCKNLEVIGLSESKRS